MNHKHFRRLFRFSTSNATLLAMGPALFTLNAGCSLELDPTAGEGTTATEDSALYYQTNGLWSSPSISVCWLATPSTTATERGWVRDAVEDAFEPLTDINFTGWGLCSGSGAEIAIAVGEDEWPRSSIGERAASMSAYMYLNHFETSAHDIDGDGSNDFSTCYSTSSVTGQSGRTWGSQREKCIETIAVHEFAHALAVRHEQGRSDTPSWCSATGVSGQTAYGYWDPLSISNYCNPLWNGEGLLSTLDISGFQDFYGTDGNEFVWYSFGDAGDFTANPIHQIAFDVRTPVDVSGTYDPIVGDLDGDGNDDVVLYGTGADDDFMYWGNSNRTFDGASEEVDGGYKHAAGDFDGDGKEDVLWYASGATSRIWWGNAQRSTNGTSISVSLLGATPLAGDFDGDGRADIFWYRSGAETDPVWFGRSDRAFDETNNENVQQAYIPGVGDFDGDGRADIFWYGVGSNQDRVWYGTAARGFTSSSALPVSGTYSWLAIGDYDGDGDDDLFWNKSGVSDSLWLFDGRDNYDSTDASYAGDEQPLVGDFDGNGHSDIFWYEQG